MWQVNSKGNSGSHSLHRSIDAHFSLDRACIKKRREYQIVNEKIHCTRFTENNEIMRTSTNMSKDRRLHPRTSLAVWRATPKHEKNVQSRRGDEQLTKKCFERRVPARPPGDFAKTPTISPLRQGTSQCTLSLHGETSRPSQRVRAPGLHLHLLHNINKRMSSALRIPQLLQSAENVKTGTTTVHEQQQLIQKTKTRYRTKHWLHCWQWNEAHFVRESRTTKSTVEQSNSSLIQSVANKHQQTSSILCTNQI